ncbi:MAG: amidohydrolase [Blautia sp.]|uniref:amidohydrolase n=1 Tax=Blautia sp. TaxID=1955243 RepID=UPI002A764CA8|nr:amidohydrolase [Blautia sp.]MDY3018216.1 amidohydrolase [Blautia sp.]
MDAIEKKIIAMIEAHREEIIAFAEDIENHPEPGFQEFRTACKTAEFLRKTGYQVEEDIALTGVKASWEKRDTQKSGDTGRKNSGYPNVTVIGEMDAIGCQRHPKADPHIGVAHACGHHAQMAVMAGAAIAFSDPEIRREIFGSLTFLAVPAEEYIDADKRTVLREKGIRFGSGKSEMIRTGVFDHTDLVMTTHVHMVDVKEDFYLGNPACNGFDAERVTVRGKAAHAAIDPWNGINALSITSSAIQMMGLMRETFREEDHVRLHNVIRKAGDVVNSVPDEAVVETKIRASSLERIQEIRRMVDRAYDGAAYAFGGKIERENLPGYMPIRPRMADKVLVEAAEELGLDYRKVQPGDFNNACTDVGDLTQLFPVINFTFRGFEGRLHGEDFHITDKEKAYILPAKLMALTIYRLLRKNGEEAEKIKEGFTAVFDKQTYIEYIEKQM